MKTDAQFISVLRSVLEAAENSQTIPMDEAEQLEFRKHYGPAIGTVGNYVIYTRCEAARLVNERGRLKNFIEGVIFDLERVRKGF